MGLWFVAQEDSPYLCENFKGAFGDANKVCCRMLSSRQRGDFWLPSQSSVCSKTKHCLVTSPPPFIVIFELL